MNGFTKWILSLLIACHGKEEVVSEVIKSYLIKLPIVKIKEIFKKHSQGLHVQQNPKRKNKETEPATK